MTQNDLKLISASNIINLRTGRGLTQAELGAMLNYSDKTISKWERGEAVPDAFVLTQLAGIFGVSVDWLLSSHDSWEPPQVEDPGPSFTYSASVIMAISVLGVMTLALAVFVTLWMIGTVEWRVFPVGISVALLTYMILDCVFKKGRALMPILMVFILSLFVLLYIFLPLRHPWQLFLLLAPAELITALSFRIRRKK